MCTQLTSLPKILAFIITDYEKLLPFEENVISLLSEVKPSSELFFVYDSSCLIMRIGALTGAVPLSFFPSSRWFAGAFTLSFLIPFTRWESCPDFIASSIWWMGDPWRDASSSFLSLNHEQSQIYAALCVDPESVKYCWRRFSQQRDYQSGSGKGNSEVAQMVKSTDKAILSGADNRPPMLEKDMYDSWKSRMELYMLNRQHGRMILESVENGPLLWPTDLEDGVTRLKKYFELSAAEAIQAD
uniref:Integrase, catalytic region, zinc finger, CCHC-type, peptidase aspartic, catalytic n=1 Tax=Tanacetum cinerariifolium TaxID=118510 RepID=A0A6L2J5K0_TANCI|nr:hypothetical protein [Tanacetum cinerariifolium]